MASFLSKLGKSLKKDLSNPFHGFTQFGNLFAGKNGLFNTLGQSMEALSTGDVAGTVKRVGGGETTAQKTEREYSDAKHKAEKVNANNQTVSKDISEGNKMQEMETQNMMAKFSGIDNTESTGSASGGVENYLDGGTGESLAMRIAKQKKRKGLV